MKPLVYWCRWHQARLLLGGRDETAVWGQLDFGDRVARFHFDLKSWELTQGEGDSAETVKLDDVGVELARD